MTNAGLAPPPAIMQVPLERWDVERLYSPDLAAGKMYTRLGAWLTAIDQFDGAMFGMHHSEAIATDPQALYARVLESKPVDVFRPSGAIATHTTSSACDQGKMCRTPVVACAIDGGPQDAKLA